MGWRGHNNSKAVTSWFQGTKLSVSFSEMEYNGDSQDQHNGSCQDTVAFASYTGYTRLMSKNNCLVESLYALLTFGKHREKQHNLNASVPERVPQKPWARIWKTCGTCLSRTLDGAGSRIPCKEKLSWSTGVMLGKTAGKVIALPLFLPRHLENVL